MKEYEKSTTNKIKLLEYMFYLLYNDIFYLYDSVKMSHNNLDKSGVLDDFKKYYYLGPDELKKDFDKQKEIFLKSLGEKGFDFDIMHEAITESKNMYNYFRKKYKINISLEQV